MWRKVRYLLILLGLCTLATCPVAKRACDQQNRSREADTMLDYLEHRLRMAAASGTPWPTVSAPMTPPRGSCCEQGGQCAADATPWLNPTWRALQFAIPAAHYFTYEYVAMPDGSVLLRAHGDVGCDGKATTHERTITLTAGKVSVTSRSD
jgi:hypothetical protein